MLSLTLRMSYLSPLFLSCLTSQYMLFSASDLYLPSLRLPHTNLHVLVTCFRFFTSFHHPPPPFYPASTGPVSMTRYENLSTHSTLLILARII